MYEIINKKILNPNVTLIEIMAPLIAKKALAGQFVILKPYANSERIPLTIAARDEAKGTITVIFQIVGHTTFELNQLEVGSCLNALVGPLGNPTDLEGVKKAIVIGGGVGSAIAYPVIKALKEKGAYVLAINGFRNQDLVILEDEIKDLADSFILTTDDGSKGLKGNVTTPLKEALEKDNYDLVVAIGPLIMMKYVSLTVKPFGVKLTVSMNPIMIDGTGMCGGCRLVVGGKMKFACVDGPDFDGYEVDYDQAMMRNRAYVDFERKAYDKDCNLFKKAGA